MKVEFEEASGPKMAAAPLAFVCGCSLRPSAVVPLADPKTMKVGTALVEVVLRLVLLLLVVVLVPLDGAPVEKLAEEEDPAEVDEVLPILLEVEAEGVLSIGLRLIGV